MTPAGCPRWHSRPPREPRAAAQYPRTSTADARPVGRGGYDRCSKTSLLPTIPTRTQRSCSPHCPTACPRPSRTSAARAGSPRPTSTRPSARSASRPAGGRRCRARRHATSSPRSSERALWRGGQPGAEPRASRSSRSSTRSSWRSSAARPAGIRLRQDRPDGHHARRPPGCRQDHPRRQARPSGSRPRATAPCWWPATCSVPTPSPSSRSAGERAGVPVFAPQPGATSELEHPAGDPVAVAAPASRKPRQQAPRRGHRRHRRPPRRRRRDDGAGTPASADAIMPDEVLFVIDAMIGQDARQHRAGLRRRRQLRPASCCPSSTATPAVVPRCRSRQVTGKPGHVRLHRREAWTDFELFHPDRMASRILDMGDVLTLIEQAEKAWDKDEAMPGWRRSSPTRRTSPWTTSSPRCSRSASMGSMKKHAHDDARACAEHPPAARELRRARDRPRRGDRPLHDPGTSASHPKIINGSRRARIAQRFGRARSPRSTGCSSASPRPRR